MVPSVSVLLALVVALVVSATTAAAQSASATLGSGGGSSSSTEADADAMLETAQRGLEDRAREVIETRRAGEPAADLAPGELDRLIASSRERLRERAAAELHPLRLDGFLSRSEATSAIGRVAQEEWLALYEAIDARFAGHPPPPRRDEAGTLWEHAIATGRYLLVDRNGAASYGMLLAAVVLGVLLAWACSRGLGALQSAMSDRGHPTLCELIGGVPGPPYAMLAVVGLAVGLRSFWIPRSMQRGLDFALDLAFAVAALWLAWSVVNVLSQSVGWLLRRTHDEPDRQASLLIRKLMQFALLVVFALVAAELLFGVELESVLVGVGLLGLAVTLAAQDSLKNLFGSLTIVLERPFKVGDLVEFQDRMGTVEDIGFRSTRLREFDGHLVTIPNADIVNEPVQNIDARPWIRRRFRIGLRYDTPPRDVQRAIDILREILGGRDDEPEAMRTHVVFEGFGESTLDLLVQYCVEPGEYWAALERGSELHLEILRRFDEAGIDFAFPTRTAVLEQDPVRPLPALRGERETTGDRASRARDAADAGAGDGERDSGAADGD